MDRELRRHTVLATLEMHGVSVCEYQVMGIVHYRIPLGPAGIADYAKRYAEDDGSILGQHMIPDYLRAIGTAIDKGWLTILTSDFLEQEADRLARTAIPEVADPCYKAGAVDFTDGGFLFYRMLLTEIFGPGFFQGTHSGWNWRADRKRLDFYACAEAECGSLLSDAEKDAVAFIGQPARVRRSVPPQPIGPWKPCRFLTDPHGYHAVAEVELLDWEVLPAEEMRRKYGLYAENRPVIRLNPERVPPGLRHLIPWAERFGIADDLIRQDFVAKTAESDLQELRRIVQEHNDLLDAWLSDPDADIHGDEYVGFSTMRMAADGV
jgi:hypothetical protein